jgi:hypothetical protein
MVAHTEVNSRKVRLGLVVVGVIFVTAIVLLFTVSDPVGRAIFVGVAVVSIVRVALLVRWIRAEGAGSPRRINV